MRINSSDVVLSSSQININTYSKNESLHIWDKNSDTTITSSQNKTELSVKKTIKKDIADLISNKNQIPNKTNALLNKDASEDDLFEILSGSIGDLRIQLIKDIIELFTGKKISIYVPSDTKNCDYKAETSDSKDESQSANQSAFEGWGINYYLNETRYSKEGAAFSANGNVTTADGKNINFSISLEMSRETSTQKTVSLKAGDALIDPIIIDISGTGVSFSDVKFEFDLDSDGDEETINATQGNSGFLAYDKNGNGIIDDGSELFGPTTGNGFGELAMLDNDNNNWIDENDAAFSALKIWQKNSDGSDSINGLIEKGVGALYCKSAETEFDITESGDGNAMAAKLKETGVWLGENGGSGVLQEVDMVV